MKACTSVGDCSFLLRVEEDLSVKQTSGLFSMLKPLPLQEEAFLSSVGISKYLPHDVALVDTFFQRTLIHWNKCYLSCTVLVWRSTVVNRLLFLALGLMGETDKSCVLITHWPFIALYLFHPPILPSHIYFMSWDIDDIWGSLI